MGPCSDPGSMLRLRLSHEAAELVRGGSDWLVGAAPASAELTQSSSALTGVT